MTENSALLDARFDFDDEILNSKPYLGAMRSNIRYGLNRRWKVQRGSEEPPPNMTTSSTISTPSERDEPGMHMTDVEFPGLRVVESGTCRSYSMGNGSSQVALNPSIRTVRLCPVDILPQKQSRDDGSMKDMSQTYGQKLFRTTFNLLANWKSINRQPLSQKEAQAARSKVIDAFIKKDRMAKEKEVKLLFLGATESGKSTVLNQMRLLCQRDYTPSERESFKPAIFSIVVKLMRNIVKAMNELDLTLDDKAGEHYFQNILSQPLDPKWNTLPSEVIDAINFLWMDSGVQRYYQRPNGCQTDNAKQYVIEKT